MIHSILPTEAIMEPRQQTAGNSQVQHIAIGNGFVRTRRDAAGQVRIESLFSTDPYDYLDPHYRPGNTW